MLKQKLTDDMKSAMKAREMTRLGTIRMMLAAIKNVEIDKGELDDEGVIAVLKSERKKMRDALEQFEAAGRSETVEEEKTKIAVVEAYLPEEMNREEIEKIVDEVIADGGDDFGKVMGKVMAKVRGQADGRMVQEIVKEKLD